MIPPYKGHEEPAAPTWDPNKGGWLSVPVIAFEALLSGGRLANGAQLRFIWEIMKAQWGSRGKGTPVTDWTDPLTDKEWIGVVGCGARQFARVKFDALYRRLVEARRDGRSLRFSVRTENWATAEKAPDDLHVYDDERASEIIAPSGQLFWESDPVLEPGVTISVPVFPCRRLQSDLDHSVRVKAEGGVLRIAAASGEESPRQADLSPRMAVEDQVEGFLLPHFVGRNFVLDAQIKRRIGEVIVETATTFEQWKDFTSGKLSSGYPWRPGLFLASDGFLDEYKEFVRQRRSTNAEPSTSIDGSYLGWLQDPNSAGTSA